MIKLIKTATIENVSGFVSENSDILYVDNKSLFEKSLYFNHAIVNESKTSDYCLKNNKILFSTWDSNSFFINDGNNLEDFVKIEGYSCYPILTNNSSIFLTKQTSEGFENFIFNTNTQNITSIGFKNLGQIIEDSRYILSENKNTIEVYSLNKNIPLWQYDLPEGKNDRTDSFGNLEKGEIQKIIGVYKDTLWLSLSSGNLLGLSTAKGELIYDLMVPNNFKEHFPDSPLRFGANYSELDKTEGKLFGMRLNYYWEIDLKDPLNSYLLYDIRTTCREKQVDISYVEYETWQGNEIVFREWSFAQDPAYVGIFNRQTRQITWTSRELGDEGVFRGINKIDHEVGRLYVLDRASTLYIFERE